MSVNAPVKVALPDRGHEIVLDWTLRHDERSLAYKVDKQFVFSTKPIRNRMWTKRVLLDQGSYRCPICNEFGACTGYSACQMLATTPKTIVQLTDEDCHKTYHGAKLRDQWTGEGYEGSSVLGAMQYLKDMKVLSVYYWATTLAEIQHGVSHYGPMVIGVDWFANMMRTDEYGFISPSGSHVGGHAIEVGGISLPREAFWLPNSWGPWGHKGTGGAWLKWIDMAYLIEMRGEFALPRKVRGGLITLT